MRFIIRLLLFLFCLNFWAQGQELPKIGYVYIDTVLFSLDATILKRRELEVYGKQLQSSLEKQQQFFQQKYQAYIEYMKIPGNVVPKVRDNKQKELQDLQEDLQQKQVEAQKNLTQKENKLIQPLYEQIQETVEDFGKSENYSYILSAANLLVVEKIQNCTEQIMKRLGGSRANVEKILKENQARLEEAQRNANQKR